jgi:hypothetical protein
MKMIGKQRPDATSRACNSSVEKRPSRAIRAAAARAKEAVMTGLGLQAWLLSLIGIRAALAHREYLEILEVIRILGNSYRLASLGVGSTVVYGRFTLDFCRVIAAGIARNLSSRHSVQQAIGSIRIGNLMANVGPRGRAQTPWW